MKNVMNFKENSVLNAFLYNIIFLKAFFFHNFFQTDIENFIHTKIPVLDV